jgi:imidazolonepropionase-like amidohydrolase
MCISGGRVLACEDTSVIEDGAVVTEGERIAWVGPAGEMPARYRGEDYRPLDATGLSVMPGLVDGHMHISFGEATSEEELAVYAAGEFRAIRAAVDAEKVLLAGVTSACDPGGYYPVSVAVRDAIAGGLVQGPRLAAAGRQITSPQGIGDPFPSWLGIPRFGIGKLVSSPAEMLEEIRLEVKDGVDLIKIAGSGVESDEFGAFRPEELELAVDEAHRLQRPATIHARSRQSVIDAAGAGFDWIMHASFMDDRGLELVLEKGIPILPAMTLLVNSLEANRDGGVISHAAVAHLERELDAASAVLRKAHEAGATLIAGSETGFAMTPYGEWHTREMAIFVERLGMSSFEALLCMTRNAAVTVPPWRADVGTLTVGKLADVLVVDGRPDDDVRVLADRRALHWIVKGGEVVRPQRAGAGVGERARMRFEKTHLLSPRLHRDVTRATLSAPDGTLSPPDGAPRE